MRQNKSVEHGVKCIQHPAQGGSDQRPTLGRRGLGKGEGDAGAGGHPQDCQCLTGN